VESTICVGLVCQFKLEEYDFEIFGSNQPVESQNAYQHLSIMYRLVCLGGNRFKQAIHQLKQQHYKTEPAIAHILQLEGNPYQAVLLLAENSDETLKKLIARNT